LSAALDAACWPFARIAEALEALAGREGMLPAEGTRRVEASPSGIDDASVTAWMDTAAERLGIDIEAVDATWPEVEFLLRRAAPAVVLLRDRDPPRCALLLGGAIGGRVRALGPDLRPYAVEVSALRAALCAFDEAPARATVRALLDSAGVRPARRARAEAAMLAQRLGAHRVGGCWLLRLDPGAPMAAQLRWVGAQRRLRRMLLSQLAVYALGGAGWYVLSRGALQGTLERAWLLGWGLALVSTIPLQLVSSWQGSALAVEVGAVFKSRLLAGVGRLDPEVVRREGSGALLGRVIESSAVEAGALSGAVASMAAVPSVFIALWVLASGPGGAAHAALYAAWLALGAALTLDYGRARSRWTASRVSMTNDLVERMRGHRTRAAQESPAHWHDDEDRDVSRYLDASARLDRAQAVITTLLPSTWTLLGVVALTPSIASGASGSSIALGVGGVLLGGASLRGVTHGLVGLLSAAIAWRGVAPMFHAAARREAASASVRMGAGEATTGAPILEALDLVFRHEGRVEPVLRGATLSLRRGDRVLLEGASGGGKSTLGALLAGLRVPSSGLMLLHGLDLRSVGASEWRRRVVTAPQFHENHVMTATLAFNLLLGRPWPPSGSDLAEAEAVCEELGLGPLLARMPAGMQQMVGEGGWRLSHGEQSRLYMARALLQGAEVTVLDESFAALDPETLRAALGCALRRCPTLVVIAHP